MKSSAEIKLITLIILVATSGFFGSCQTKRASSAVPTANIQPQSAQSGEVPSPDTDSYRKIADGLSAALKGYNQTKPQTHQTLPVPSDPQKLADSIEKNGETAAALTNIALAEQAATNGNPPGSAAPASTGGMMWFSFITNKHLEEIGVASSFVAVSLAVGLVAVSQYKLWKVRQLLKTDKAKVLAAEAKIQEEIAKQKNDPTFLAEQATIQLKIGAAEAEVRRLEGLATAKGEQVAAARKLLAQQTEALRRAQAVHEAKGRDLAQARLLVQDAIVIEGQARVALETLVAGDATLNAEILAREAQAQAQRTLSAEIEARIPDLTIEERTRHARMEAALSDRARVLAEESAKVDAAAEARVAANERADQIRPNPFQYEERKAPLLKEAARLASTWDWVRANPARDAVLKQIAAIDAELERANTLFLEAANESLRLGEAFDAAVIAAERVIQATSLQPMQEYASAEKQLAEARAAAEKAKLDLSAIEERLAQSRAASDEIKAKLLADRSKLEALNADLAQKRAREAQVLSEHPGTDTAQKEAQQRVSAQGADVDKLAAEKTQADAAKTKAEADLASEKAVKPKAASTGVDAARASKEPLVAKQGQTQKLYDSQKKSAKGHGIAGALFGTVGIGILVPSVVGLSKGGLGLAQDDARARLLSDLQGLELRWQKLYGKKILEAEASQKK